MALVLDAGALIAYERGDRAVSGLLQRARRANVPVRTSASVVAQVWRGGPRQARLARALSSAHEEPLDAERARAIGMLLGLTRTSDVVDAALVDLALDGDRIVTADPADIAALVAATGRRIRIIAI
jgi:hypothetical protein